MDKKNKGNIHDFANGYINQSIDQELAKQGIDIKFHPELKKEVQELKNKLNKDYKTEVKKNRLLKKFRSGLRAIIYSFALTCSLIFLFPNLFKIEYSRNNKINSNLSKNMDIMLFLIVLTGSLFEFIALFKDGLKK